MTDYVVQIPTPSGIASLVVASEPVSEVKTKLPNGAIGHFHLVDKMDPSASAIRVMTPRGIFALGNKANGTKKEEGDTLKIRGLQAGREMLIWTTPGTKGKMTLVDDQGAEILSSVNTPPSLQFVPASTAVNILTNFELSAHVEFSDQVINISEVVKLTNNAIVPLPELFGYVNYSVRMLPGSEPGVLKLIDMSDVVVATTTDIAPTIEFTPGSQKLQFVATAPANPNVEVTVLLDKQFKKGTGGTFFTPLPIRIEEPVTLMAQSISKSASFFVPYLEPGKHYEILGEADVALKITMDSHYSYHNVVEPLTVSPDGKQTYLRFEAVMPSINFRVNPNAAPAMIPVKVTVKEWTPPAA